MHSTPVQPPQSLLYSLYFNLIIVEELDLITTAFLVWHNTLNLILIPRHCKTSLFFSGQSGNRCLNASQHSSVCFLQKRTSYDSCLCSSKRALLWFFACLRDTSLCFYMKDFLCILPLIRFFCLTLERTSFCPYRLFCLILKRGLLNASHHEGSIPHNTWEVFTAVFCFKLLSS